MSEWIKCEDRLPNLEGKPDYGCSELVIVFRSGRATAAYYARQMYNKTEKGREPRWEDMSGRITAPPTHWMPLPSPPGDSQ